MTTITLTPENFGKQIALMYEEVLRLHRLEIAFPATNTAPKRRKKTFRERMEDPKNTSYGPFEGKEAIDFLKSQLV